MLAIYGKTKLAQYGLAYRLAVGNCPYIGLGFSKGRAQHYYIELGNIVLDAPNIITQWNVFLSMRKLVVCQ